MYIQYKTFGIKDKCQIKHVVIDEAQDYGEFQFDVLKKYFKKQFYDNFGRYSSGVHFYRGIENWKRFIDVEFKDVSVTYTTLKKLIELQKKL